MSCTRPMKKARVSNCPVDRISSFPSDIVDHILSFVSTKVAVQTCVLSKRWRKTWNSVPILNLDIDDFLPEGHELVLNEEEIERREAVFSKFVIGVLQNREMLSLDTFRLQWGTKGRSKYCTSELVDQCVTYATEFNPRVLSVHIFKYDLLKLNHNKIFTCASLEEISLMLRTDIRSYQAMALRKVSLPRLKRLEIGYVTICDYSLGNLFMGCPALEELELRECFLYTSEICSTGLKSLVLYRCITHQTLQLSTPNLKKLKILESEDMKEIFLGNMASLVDVTVSMPKAYDDYEFGIILKSLSSASSLDLSFQHLPNATAELYTKKNQVQNEDGVKFPEFKNLRSLVLGNMGSCDVDLVVLFLRHSPNLQELTWQDNKLQFNSAVERRIASIEVEMKIMRREFERSE